MQPARRECFCTEITQRKAGAHLGRGQFGGHTQTKTMWVNNWSYNEAQPGKYFAVGDGTLAEPRALGELVTTVHRLQTWHVASSETGPRPLLNWWACHQHPNTLSVSCDSLATAPTRRWLKLPKTWFWNLSLSYCFLPRWPRAFDRTLKSSYYN